MAPYRERNRLIREHNLSCNEVPRLTRVCPFIDLVPRLRKPRKKRERKIRADARVAESYKAMPGPRAGKTFDDTAQGNPLLPN